MFNVKSSSSIQKYKINPPPQPESDQQGCFRHIARGCTKDDGLSPGNDGFFPTSDGLCTENDGFFTENDGFCTEKDGFFTENDGFLSTVRSSGAGLSPLVPHTMPNFRTALAQGYDCTLLTPLSGF